MQLILAHGASGNAASMQPWVDGTIARGHAARAIDLPVRKAESTIDVYRSVAGLAGAGCPPTIVGGHSYGGRVASLLTATDADDPSSPIRGLVLLSYPLHRPGDPSWDARTSHWPDIGVPVLLLSGEADPFARIDLLRGAVEERLSTAELVTWPRLGHTLASVRDDALDRIARFMARV